MKKTIMILLGIIFIISLGLISSCTKNENKVEKSKKVILTFSGVGFPAYDRIRTQQGKDFEVKHPHITTKYQFVSGQDYTQKTMTQIAGGTAPDIIWILPSQLPQFVKKNTLVNLTSYIDADKNFNISQFHSRLIDAYTFEGAIYGLPGSFTPRVMYYNKYLFDNVGLLYPDNTWTWDNFLNACQRLTKVEKNGKILQFGASLAHDNWILFIKQNGGNIWNEEKTKCIIDNIESFEGVDFFNSFFSKYHVIPTPTDIGTLGIYETFLTGKAGVYFGGRWMTVTFRQIKDFDWGFTQLPKGKVRATNLDSHGWSITAQCKYKKEAWEFIKHITGPEGARYVIAIGDSVPTLKSMSESKDFIQDPQHPNENNAIFIESIPYAYSEKDLLHPNIPYEEMMDIINIEFEKLQLGLQSAKETLEIIEGKLNKRIKGLE